MVKHSLAVVLMALTLACGMPSALGALNIPDNCASTDAAVWTGWIHGERRDTLSDPTGSITHQYTTSIKIRLREIKDPDHVHIVKSDPSAKYGIRYVGCRIKLKVEASEIRTGYDGACSNQTTSTYTDTAKDGSGEMAYKTANEPVRVVSDENIPPEGVYMLTFAPPGMWSPCKDRFPEVAYKLGNYPLQIGNTRFYGYHLTDQQVADNYGDPKLRLLSEKHTRMTGSYAYITNKNATSIKVLWDICREGNKDCAGMPASSPPAAAPKPPCDPKLQADADRKWNSAQDLFAAGAKHLAETDKAFREWRNEEAKAMGEIALEKKGLLTFVEEFLKEGGKHLLHQVAGWFGMATTAAWIYTDIYPHLREHDQSVRDAAKMVDAGAKLAGESIQDMQSVLAQASACEEVRQKTIAHEKLLDQAKALREKWALDGSALYKEDPNDPNAYPMDAGAALNRAIQILSANSAASSKSAAPPSPAQAAQTVRDLKSRATSAEGLTITAAQARAALAEVDGAIRMMDTGRELMIKRHAFAEKWGADLANLVAKWK